MAHSKVRNWVHIVFSTKYRNAQILPSIEKRIHRMLFHQLTQSGCFVEALNGMPDHIHLLVLLPPERSLSEVVQICKGGSSHEINGQSLLPVKFAWQTGYYAFSVSESKVPVIRRYIQQQKAHHRIQDMAEELAWLERLHGLIP